MQDMGSSPGATPLNETKIKSNQKEYTDKKENQIFLIYKEIQSGPVVRKCFLIYEEIRKYIISPYMRRPLVICDFATAPL
jgi:hypothetical protein